MRGVGRWQEEESPEMKTPATLKEQVNSHPLDVDSGSEASFTSALEHEGDFPLSPGAPQSPKRPQAPSDGADTEHKAKQQASSQTADFIASHTPTRLSKAQGMGASVQSLAHQVAFAAAKRANAVPQNIRRTEDAADTNLDLSSTTTTVTPASAASATTAKPIVLYSKRPSANWHRETADDDEMQGKSSNMVSKSTQSLADITNSTYDKPTRMTKKVISGRLPDYVLPKRTAVDKTAEANSCLTLVLDWTLSTLYYSSGVAAAVAEGIARGLSARH